MGRALRPGRRGRRQNIVEVIILVGIVGLGMAFVATKLPAAITKHYAGQRQVVASPL